MQRGEFPAPRDVTNDAWLLVRCRQVCGTAEASTASDGYELDAESKEQREYTVQVKFPSRFDEGTTPCVVLMHRRLNVGVVNGEAHMGFGARARDVTCAGFTLAVTAEPMTRMASFAIDWLAHAPPAATGAGGAGAGAGADGPQGPEGVPLPELMQVFTEPLSFEVRACRRGAGWFRACDSRHLRRCHSCQRAPRSQCPWRTRPPRHSPPFRGCRPHKPKRPWTCCEPWWPVVVRQVGTTVILVAHARMIWRRR